MSDFLWHHGMQHARPPCSSPTPRVYLNLCPLSQWCHPTISSSAVPFSCLQSSPASGSFPRSQCFESGGQSTGASASASVLPMNIQDWFPLGLTGWSSLQSKGLSRIFSSTTIWKHHFFCSQPSLGFPGGSDGNKICLRCGFRFDPGSIAGLWRSHGEWNGNPLQDSCLENSMNRGAWQAI